MKDRINEKRLPIPSVKTCWEIQLCLLEMPASVATPPAKRSLMSLRTTTSHSSSHLSPLSIEHRTHPSLSILHHYRAHYSSFCLLDTSFVASIMTVISVWERKKEKKKWVKEAGRAMAAMISVTGNRAAVSNRR